MRSARVSAGKVVETMCLHGVAKAGDWQAPLVGLGT